MIQEKIIGNMRLLCLPSQGRGEDYFKLSHQIDETIQAFGLDLAEEAVYLIYDRGPGAVLGQEAHCLVGRSVIGPKREYQKPMQVMDWNSKTVFWADLKASEWEKVWDECLGNWEELQKANKSVAPSFMIKLGRSLNPGLEMKASVLFHE